MDEQERAAWNQEFQANNSAARDAADKIIAMLVLINGGAAVAVLSSLSSVAETAGESPDTVRGVAEALMLYAWGLVAAVVAGVCAYFTHYANAATAARYVAGMRWEIYPWIKRAFHFTGILAVVISGVLFVMGSLAIKEAVLSFLG
ncbi:hypothetical protein [Frigidibacter sp. MR17.24]|uniref:hypothetical protein n=1 Tax=Frigidibacter sp. MR17.24 TaxID=3127345 RepID=UPI003012CD93